MGRLQPQSPFHIQVAHKPPQVASEVAFPLRWRAMAVTNQAFAKNLTGKGPPDCLGLSKVGPFVFVICYLSLVIGYLLRAFCNRHQYAVENGEKQGC